MDIIHNFVVFEGADGSGTTTQLELLEGFFHGALDSEVPRLYRTAEPTTSPIGNLIRQSLRGEIHMGAKTLAYLFAADRNEHLFTPNGIIERCSRGELVVCDRYILSSLVYQGLTCGEELPATLNAAFPLPELLLYFDIDSDIAAKRMEKRPVKDIYEVLEFQIKVRERYQALLPRLASAGVRVERIDASASETEIEVTVLRLVVDLTRKMGYPDIGLQSCLGTYLSRWEKN
ncbi:MAG: dTMP kinase [Treponema sp.]|jgi:dTMP kinase|nr:dTMP kinase [Treponema sp.]